MGRLSDAARKARRRISEALPQQTVTLLFGTVTAVSTGDTTVNVQGAEVDCTSLASYTPTVGDQVAVLLIDGAPLILGAVVYTPSE